MVSPGIFPYQHTTVYGILMYGGLLVHLRASCGAKTKQFVVKRANNYVGNLSESIFYSDDAHFILYSLYGTIMM